MSLKAVHLFFVTSLSGMSFVCAGWKFKVFFSAGQRSAADLAFGIGALLIGAAVVVYGRAFLKKLKHISYL